MMLFSFHVFGITNLSPTLKKNLKLTDTKQPFYAFILVDQTCKTVCPFNVRDPITNGGFAKCDANDQSQALKFLVKIKCSLCQNIICELAGPRLLKAS